MVNLLVLVSFHILSETIDFNSNLMSEHKLSIFIFSIMSLCVILLNSFIDLLNNIKYYLLKPKMDERYNKAMKHITQQVRLEHFDKYIMQSGKHKNELFTLIR